MKKLTVLGNNLLVEPLYDEDKSGIIAPDVAKNKVATNFGIIHAFGKKFHEAHPSVVRGNRALFRPFGTHEEITLNGKRHLFVDASYLIGIVE